MPFIIGLTGGIASGKTQVSDHFERAHQIDIIDADVIARQVVEPNTPALKEIENRFGAEILRSDKSLNRAKLREIIFNHEAEKDWLNQLLHPIIRKQIQASLAQATSPYAILVAPLLIENKLEYLVDRVLVVDVDEATQLKRTTARDNVSISQVKAILSAQIDRKTRLAQADDVINNNDIDLNQLKQQVDTLHYQYLAMAKAKQDS